MIYNQIVTWTAFASLAMFLSISDSRRARFNSVCMFSSALGLGQASFCLQLLRAIFSSKTEKAGGEGSVRVQLVQLTAFCCFVL